MNKTTHTEDWVAEDTAPATFKLLIEEKHELEFKLRNIQDKVIRKCLSEGWSDCIKVDWAKVARRANSR